MASHSSSSAAETPGANATPGRNLRHYTIQVDSVDHRNQHFVKEILDRNWKNEELLKLLDSYFDDTHKTINFDDAGVQEYLRSANNYQSLIFQHGEEGSFKPLNFSHHHFFHNLASVYTRQLLMRDTLQSFQNDLSQKLHRAKYWTKASAVAFTAAVMITSAAAAAATARNPATATAAAAAAAAPILLGTIGSWTVSLLKKYKDGVRKHVEITGVMAVGAKIIMNDLSSLHLSARWFEFHTKSVSEMAADAGEVRKKLMESFQELQGKAADFSRDIRLARELTLQSVIKHLDCITTW